MPNSKAIVQQDAAMKAYELAALAAKHTPKKGRGNDRSMTEFDKLDKIAASLPRVKGLGDIAASEFDDLAQRATNTYDDLVDLGMNVEARFAGRIFEVAAGMLRNALDAKTAKIDMKLKMIDLQLKKEKMDRDTAVVPDAGVAVQGEGFIVTDRNSLLEKFRGMQGT